VGLIFHAVFYVIGHSKDWLSQLLTLLAKEFKIDSQVCLMLFLNKCSIDEVLSTRIDQTYIEHESNTLVPQKASRLVVFDHADQYLSQLGQVQALKETFVVVLEF
jgi:hypothetical protein